MGEIDPRVETLHIWWDRFQTHIDAYLIKGRQYAVVDSGPPQTPFAGALEPFGLGPADIGLALITHGHSDHIGGNADLKEAGAKLMIHAADAVCIEDHEKAFERFQAPLVRALAGEAGLAQAKADFIKDVAPELAVDRKLEDNDRIDLEGGIELRVVHLPGHSPGSVGFYWEAQGILFTGDSVPGLGTAEGSLPILYDLEAYEASVKRLTEMPLQVILSTHPYRGLSLAPATIKKKGEVKQFLSDSLDAIRRIREAIALQATKGSGRPLTEITEEVIAALPEKMGFKPLAALPVPQFSLQTVFWGLHPEQAEG